MRPLVLAAGAYERRVFCYSWRGGGAFGEAAWRYLGGILCLGKGGRLDIQGC